LSIQIKSKKNKMGRYGFIIKPFLKN